MASLLRSGIRRSCHLKILSGLIAVSTFNAPIQASANLSFSLFHHSGKISCEELTNRALGLIKIFKKMKPSVDQYRNFLNEFLAEFNSLYNVNITKEEWLAISLDLLEQKENSLADDPIVLETMFVLLDMNEIKLRNISYGGDFDQKIEDQVAIGCTGLLVAGLIATLSIAFPPAAPAILTTAGTVAAASVNELVGGLKDQSTKNNMLHHGSFKANRLKKASTISVI